MEQAPSDTFESLSEAIVALCGHIHGAEYRLIELIRRLEALRPWNRERPDCAHWRIAQFRDVAVGAHVREAGVAIRLMQRNAEGRGQLRRADALTVLAERFLARVPEADESLSSADRFLVTVHAPAEALPEHAAIDAEDPPQFEDGSVAAPETVRRLCCDAAVVRILASGDGFEIRGMDAQLKKIFAQAAQERLAFEKRGVRVPTGYSSRPLRRHEAGALEPP